MIDASRASGVTARMVVRQQCAALGGVDHGGAAHAGGVFFVPRVLCRQAVAGIIVLPAAVADEQQQPERNEEQQDEHDERGDQHRR